MSIDTQMKHISEKRKNIARGSGLLFVGLALGIGIATSFPLLTEIIKGKSQSQSQPVKVADEAELKKQALAKFYNEIITAQDKQDWATLYSFVRQSVRNNVSKDVFIAHETAQIKKRKIVSQDTIIQSIVVNGDNGTVERTIVTCLAKDCTGNNRKEDYAKKKYEYVGGRWQIPDPEPSERALKAATFTYFNESPDDQKKLVGNWGFGSADSNFAIKQYAINLDSDQSLLISEETRIEKYKADQANKPKVIYQQTPVYIPEPVYQPAPVIPFPRNCTSNTIGDYTYTNCY